MLYEKGKLLGVYGDRGVGAGDRFYADIAAGTAEWAMREMQSPEGGYYSSFDADSEGHEGKFYVWDREEVRQALGDAEYAVFAARFGLDRPANFEGKWHLHIFQLVDDIAQNQQLTPRQVESLIESARPNLPRT